MLHKPRGMIAIMFGAPSRFAHEPGPDRDEDNLDREDDHQDKDGGDDERPEDSLTKLYHGLCDGHQEAAHDAMAIAQCLQKMVHAASREDDKGLQHWYEQCCQLVDKADYEGDRDGQH